MKDVRILRVDPVRRTVAALQLKAVRDCTPQIRRMIRATTLGFRDIMMVDGDPLRVIGRTDVDEAMQGWRLRGTEDTAGIGILVGHSVELDVLVDAPVSKQWVLDRIQWLDGENVEDREARADEIIPMLDGEVRAALEAGYVTPTGDVWITALAKETVGLPLIALGLGTERSGGQMLTKLGETVHDKLVFGASLATEDAHVG